MLMSWDIIMMAQNNNNRRFVSPILTLIGLDDYHESSDFDKIRYLFWRNWFVTLTNVYYFVCFQDEEQREPIRAAKLKSYLTRRVGSGYTMQSDPTRRGEFYIEVRISNCQELEAISTNRWKHSLLCFKTAVNDDSPTWKAVTQLVGTVKEDYSSIQPILYPQNPF